MLDAHERTHAHAASDAAAGVQVLGLDRKEIINMLTDNLKVRRMPSLLHHRPCCCD